jgi:hypothetical protein
MKRFVGMIAFAGLLALGAGQASAASDWQCQEYAANVANASVNPGQNTIQNGLLGAGVGALIAGATKGNVATGAAIGGGVGIVGTAAANNDKWNRKYQKAYYKCMNGGGPAPQPVYGGGYDDGSPEWYQACAAKYKSFQWEGPYEGMFKGYDGDWHPCQL